MFNDYIKAFKDHIRLEFKEHSRLASVAIVLIGIGIGASFWAGIIINDANQSQNSNEIKFNEITPINITGGGDEQDSTKIIKAEFETLEVFTGDKVKLTVSAPQASTNLSEIKIYVGTSDLDSSDHNKLLESLEGLPPDNTLTLYPNSDPPFTGEKPFKFTIDGQRVVIYAISKGINNTYYPYKSNVIFTVYSQIDKLQVKTNNAILEQNAEQEKTNKIFIGLTLLGVAITPMLIGADILLRIHFETKDDEKKTRTKWHMPFYD